MCAENEYSKEEDAKRIIDSKADVNRETSNLLAEFDTEELTIEISQYIMYNRVLRNTL